MHCNSIVIIAVLFCLHQCYANKDTFNEELIIKQLPSGHIYAHFQFTTLWNTNIKQLPTHYHLFPKTIGALMSKSSVREFHFSMTQGLWRVQKWGYPISAAPPGGELWAWFRETVEDVDKQWLELTSALSGIFCTSGNIVNQLVTVQPELSFRPMGISSGGEIQNSTFLRYTSLPRELVCTENLTPWKKLLPCFSTAGLATLLNSGWLFDTNYHSLSIGVKPVCVDKQCNSEQLELSQSVAVVYDVTRKGSSLDWSLTQLFGSVITKSCAVASTSKIYVDDTSLSPNHCTLSPTGNGQVTGLLGNTKTRYTVYDLKGGDYIGSHISSKCKLPHVHRAISPPAISAHQFTTGYGQEVGGIMCDISNSVGGDVTIVYMLTVPWYIRLYLHTLTLTDYRGRRISPLYKYYIPGKDRVRSHHLEIILRVPHLSTIHLSLKYELAFLRWTEYPPDANHGFYIPSSVISAQLMDASNMTALQFVQGTAMLVDRLGSVAPPYFIRFYTESLLVSVPTPDFSMPYNVICLTCTVIAIAFGSIHNMTTRRLLAKPKSQQPKQTGKLALVKEKVRVLWARLRLRRA